MIFERMRGRRMTMRFLAMLAVTIIAAVLLLASCAEEETPVEGAEEGTGVEEVESEQTDALRLSCQLAKAEEDGFDTDALATEIGEAEEAAEEAARRLRELEGKQRVAEEAARRHRQTLREAESRGPTAL